MTGHTSNEQIGDREGERSRDSDGIADNLNTDRGVVQDSPGTRDTGTVDSQNSGNGNLTEFETGRPDPEFGEGAEP